MAGFTNNWYTPNYFWLLKLSETGAVIWKRLYGDDGNYTDSGLLVEQTPDDGYVICSTKSFGAGNEDIQLIKLRKNGDIQWQKRIGGSGNDRACCLRQTRDGGYIIGGWTNIALDGNNYESLLIKLNRRGGIEWKNNYGGGFSDRTTSIIQTDDNGYLMAGWTYSFSEDDRDIWVLKLEADGTLQWQKTYDGSKLDAHYTIKQGNGGLYTVECCNLLQDHYEVISLELKQNGEIDCKKTYSAKYLVGYTRMYFAHRTKDDGYVLAGETKSSTSGDRNVLIMKLQPEGAVSWIRTYGGKEDDYSETVQQTLDGGYIMAGWTYSFGVEGRSIWIVKLDKQGQMPEDKILQTLDSASQDSKIASVPVMLLTGVPLKLTVSLDRQNKLNLCVSGETGHRYGFPWRDIPAIRQALAQALALIEKQKRNISPKKIAEIICKHQTLTYRCRATWRATVQLPFFCMIAPSKIRLHITIPLLSIQRRRRKSSMPLNRGS